MSKLAEELSSALRESIIEYCAQVADKYADESGYAHEIAQEIRELKESK